MEHETLFTATKWEILKILENKPHSPIEISKAINSSLANISQQLRLLEMAGLVTSKRISNRDKGQPRVLYSLAGNLSYVIATTDSFVDKKVLKLSDLNKVVLRIWFLEDPNVRYALEKVFWKLESSLEKIHELAYAGIEKGKLVIEFSGNVKLPVSVKVNGAFPEVILRSAKNPSGHMLYERRSE